MQRALRKVFTVLVVLGPGIIQAMPTSTDARIEQELSLLRKGRAIEQTQISPDGARLAWVVESDDRLMVELAAADGTGVHPLNAKGEDHPCSESNIAWAPDSRHLAYIAQCGRSAAGTSRSELRIVDVDQPGRSSRQVILHGNAHALAWSGDGRELGFLYVPGSTRQANSSSAATPDLNEIGVDDLEVQHIALLGAVDTAPRLLTGSGTYVYEFSWSPDGGQVAYIAAPPPGDNNWWIAKLYRQALAGKQTAQLLVDPMREQGSLHGMQMAVPRWSPDASRIAFIGGLMSGVVGGDIYSVPADGGSVVNLTPGADVTSVWLAWASSDALWVSQIHDGRSRVARYKAAATGAALDRVAFDVPAYLGDGSAYMALSFARDATHTAYIQSSMAKDSEVYAGPIGSTSAVTSINADLRPVWGKSESIAWDHHGVRAQGWLLYPAHYDPAKRYPMIVMVHGGPASAVVPYWPGISFGGGALLSAEGYFVFMPNPRGSFGEGERYVQANRRSFGDGDLDDMLAGIDAIEHRLPVDDQRLGLMGWSYGGFMSMFVPTRTTRFRAAVAGAGIADWQSYYGQNRIDQWMIPYFGATVYDDPAAYAKISAINFIKQDQTPTLLLVGDSDEECPASQSFEMWHALRHQHVATSLVVYPNEGHAFADPQHRMDLLRRSLQWFDQHIPRGNDKSLPRGKNH